MSAFTPRLGLIVALALAASFVGAPSWCDSPSPPLEPRPTPSLDDVRALFGKGEYAAADSVGRVLLARADSTHDPMDIETAKIIDAIVAALAYLPKARDPASRALAERAIAIRERALGPDHPDVAKSRNRLAILLWRNGSLAEARSLFEETLPALEAALGPDHLDVAKASQDFANVLVQDGDYDAARPLLERALSIHENAREPDSHSIATALNSLGELHRTTGDYSGARRFHERALQMRESTLGPDHPLVASSLANLGRALYSMGDYAGARPLYERSLAIREKTLGPGHPFVAISITNLAILLQETGRYAEAKPLFERALAIFEKELGPEHQNVGLALHNLASVLDDMGQPLAAKPLFQRALAIHEKALGPDHTDLAGALERLGRVHVTLGEYEDAEPLLERALAIHETSYGEDHPILSENLCDLAALYLGLGERDRALEACLRAEAVSREHLRFTARSLAEREALRYEAIRKRGLDLALGLIEKEASIRERRAAWDVVVRSRGIVLDEMAMRHRRVREIGDLETARLVGELDAARGALASILVRGPSGDASLYRQQVDECRTRQDAAERALALRSLTYREEEERSRLGFDEIAAALPAGSSLVGYVRYEGAEAAGNAASARRADSASSVSGHRYLAFIQSAPAAEPALVPLGGAEEIEALASRWEEEAAEGMCAASRSAAEAEAAYREVGGALRAKVWDPVAARVGSAKRVFIVPDGALHLVNFAALPAGPRDYLVETGPLFHLLTSERDLASHALPEETGHGILAMGGADFDAPPSPVPAIVSRSAEAGAPSADGGAPIEVASFSPYRGARSACGGFEKVRFSPLPGSASEIERICSLWESGRGDLEHGEAARLVGAAASEGALKRLAPGRRILHVATHGFFLGRCFTSDTDSSRGIGGLKPTEPARTSTPDENPLLLSGLALSGANLRDQAGPEDEDGVVTAEEIAAIDLSGVAWAVLSGCDTGVGEIAAGEGVFGLRRAFRVAGVRTVIMSLWAVKDEAAREWMQALYEARLVKRLGTAEAAREASLATLRASRAAGESTHPFSWGAFVAAGDWR